jgi:hypothetical protein
MAKRTNNNNTNNKQSDINMEKEKRNLCNFLKVSELEDAVMKIRVKSSCIALSAIRILLMYACAILPYKIFTPNRESRRIMKERGPVNSPLS